MEFKGIKHKIGKIVYFYNFSNTNYSYKLENFKKYSIINISFDHKGDVYYTVNNKCWYNECDFLSFSEYRKYKLNNLNIKTK